MNLSTAVIAPISGAVIGYFTNWLAIKMLFRPYTEKKLFGLRIPFTPGLIAKGRHGLAKKLGETTAKNVLTKEVLVSSINSEETAEKTRALISRALDGFMEKPRTLGGLKDSELWKDTAASLITRLAREISETGILSELATYANGILIDFLKDPANVSHLEKISGGLGAAIGKAAKSVAEDENFIGEITGFADKFGDMLSQNGNTLSHYVKGDIHGLISRLGTTGSVKLADLIDKLSDIAPSLDESLRKLVAGIAKDSFGTLIGIFVSYDKIYDNIKVKLSDYLKQEENQRLIAEKISAFLDEKKEMRVAELFALLPDSFRSSVSGLISGPLAAKLPALIADKAPDLADLVMKKTLGMDDNLYSLALRFEPELEEKIKALITRVLSALPELVGQKAPMLAEKLFELDLRAPIARLSPDDRAKLSDTLSGIAVKVLSEIAPHIAESLDISKLIEDKINSFEMEQAENLIVSVVSKELSAITWFGGLLGLIIGLVPMITEMLGL